MFDCRFVFVNPPGALGPCFFHQCFMVTRHQDHVQAEMYFCVVAHISLLEDLEMFKKKMLLLKYDSVLSDDTFAETRLWEACKIASLAIASFILFYFLLLVFPPNHSPKKHASF